MFDYDTPWKEKVKFFGTIALGGIALLGASMFGMPIYNVWEQEQTGRAELARASMNRQIAEYDAQATIAAAEAAATAEVARARGNAEANAIVASGLRGPEADRYLEYLYIQALNDSDTAVVYVPTEAGLPILETNRQLRGRQQ